MEIMFDALKKVGVEVDTIEKQDLIEYVIFTLKPGELVTAYVEESDNANQKH